MLRRVGDALSRRWAPALAVLGAVGFFVVENARVHAPIDDAYIFHRYAKNLAAGLGLAFNAGERVEGFTSLAWTLLTAAGVRVGVDPVATTHWLGVASGALLLACTGLLAAHGLDGRARAASALAPWLLALCLPFAIWSTSGLEAALFAAATTAALVALQRERFCWASGIAAAAAVVRPEGLLLALLVVVLTGRRNGARHPATLTAAAVAVGVQAALLAFRIGYFGAPLPNTFYAKVGGAIPWWGGFYVLELVTQTALPMIVPAVAAWRDPAMRPGLLWAGLVLGFVLLVGGDAFPSSRFFLPALPVLVALVARGAITADRATLRGRLAVTSVAAIVVWLTFGTTLGLAALCAAGFAAAALGTRGVPRLALWAAAPGAALVVVSVALRHQPLEVRDDTPMSFRLAAEQRLPAAPRWVELEETRRGWRFLSELGRLTAERLEKREPRDKLVATLGIGSVGYHSSARVLDLAGLVDPTIARSHAPGSSRFDFAFPGHQRSNADYVFRRKPDYLLIPRAGSAFMRVPAVTALWEHPELARSYRWDRRLPGYRRSPPRRERPAAHPLPPGDRLTPEE